MTAADNRSDLARLPKPTSVLFFAKFPFASEAPVMTHYAPMATDGNSSCSTDAKSAASIALAARIKDVLVFLFEQSRPEPRSREEFSGKSQ